MTPAAASAGPAAEPTRARRHVVHVIPSFGIGGVPLRMARVMTRLGPSYRHSIVALDSNFAAADRLDGAIDAARVEPPRASGGPAGRLLAYRRMLRALAPDLLLTFNWGAVEWALAHRLRPRFRHIHFEAGFGKEEADRQLRRRVLLRRVALAEVEKVVVPSRKLERLALEEWQLPVSKVLYIPEGVDVAAFARPTPSEPLWAAGAAALGAPIVGTVAPLRPEKNVGRLLRAFAKVAAAVPAVLAIAGDGSERPALERLARELGIADRVMFLGSSKAAAVLPHLDVFALSSDTEQMPIALLEAMAAGRPVAAVDVGDVRDMVAPENRQFVVDRDDPEALAKAMLVLLRSPERRTELGARNRRRAERHFEEEKMMRAYERLFAGSLENQPPAK